MCADCAENTFLAEHDVLDSLIVAQAIHHKTGIAYGISRCFCDARAFSAEWFAFCGCSVPNGKLVAGFEKIGRHTGAHCPETKIRDFLNHFLITARIVHFGFVAVPAMESAPPSLITMI